MVGLWPVTFKQKSYVFFSVAMGKFERVITVEIIHNSISPFPDLSNLPIKFCILSVLSFLQLSGKLTRYLSLTRSSPKIEISLLVFITVAASDSF